MDSSGHLIMSAHLSDFLWTRWHQSLETTFCLSFYDVLIFIAGDSCLINLLTLDVVKIINFPWGQNPWIIIIKKQHRKFALFNLKKLCFEIVHITRRNAKQPKW